MLRLRSVGAAAAAVAMSAGLLVGADSASAKPIMRASAQDRAFLKGNHQVNMAEELLGNYVLANAKDPSARALAKKTIADHVYADKVVQKLAAKYYVHLPATVNYKQTKAYAQLTSHNRVNLNYFVLQIAGHKTSIKSVQLELRGGYNKDVLTYAKVYLPIAQMHLKMAEADLAKYYKNS